MPTNKRKNGRRKGANGEREAARFLSKYVLPDGTPVEAKRMARNGQKGQADLEHNIPGVHFEVKRREGIDIGTKALAEAMGQAAADKGDNLPAVLWRRNRTSWNVSLYSICDQTQYVCISTLDAHDFLVGYCGITLAT